MHHESIIILRFSIYEEHSCCVHPNLHNVTPFISLDPREHMFSIKYSSSLSHFLPSITDFDIKIIHQKVQTIFSHASCCRHCYYCCYCNVDFVLIHNITCYTISLSPRIHVNTPYLLNIMCTLVPSSMVLRRLESLL